MTAVAVVVAVTACADPTETVSTTRAERRSEIAPLVDVTTCSPATIEGSRIYPDVDEGVLPPSVVVRALLWCSFNEYHQQMVGRRDDAVVDTLAQIIDVTMSQAEVEAVCSAAMVTEPALFALTDQGSYRLALPRDPDCKTPTAAVSRALDANNPTWLITENQQRRRS